MASGVAIPGQSLMSMNAWFLDLSACLCVCVRVCVSNDGRTVNFTRIFSEMGEVSIDQMISSPYEVNSTLLMPWLHAK